jgi:epoxyqueuosine reductase
MSIEATLRSIAETAHLSGVGFCSAEPFPEVKEALEAAVDSGRSASLGFTFSDPATATAPQASFPWARSMVVVAHTYLPAAGLPPRSRPGTGRIARFASDDHYVALRSGLDQIRQSLIEAGFQAEVLYDDNRLVDRAAAVRAGIAWWGKSAMVLAPGSGPWMLLGSVVTDAELAPDQAMQRDCGTCDACIPACPTGAIIAPGVLDSRRCLAAISQSRGSIPLEFREAMEDRVYGCDDCLTACPPGERLAALELLATADRRLRLRFAHFYVPRNQARFLKRNAIVALGNSQSPEYAGVLAGLLGHPDALLRAHAAWALGRVGAPGAALVLQTARGTEAATEVVEEIDLALSTLG